jgi:hypothetical protein
MNLIIPEFIVDFMVIAVVILGVLDTVTELYALR